MNKLTLLCLLLLCFGQTIKAQQPTDSISKTTAVDSLKTDLKQQGVTLKEVSFVKREIDPLAPSRAAFYSAVLPGLGQIYNKRYWKAPIVWGALGVGIYNFVDNNNQYNRVRDAFKRRRAGFKDDEFFARNDGTIDPNNPRVSNTGLEDAQESIQRNRDLWLVVTIGFYALNIIDANVDAHLKQYNVDERLGYEIKPYFNFNEITNDPNLGLAVTLTF